MIRMTVLVHLMNAEYVMVIIQFVLIVRVFQMEIPLLMNVVYVTVISQMIVSRIVLECMVD